MAANNIGNSSRHFYNSKLSKRQKFDIHNQLANRKENILQYDKASNRSIRIRSRTFNASSTSVKISTATLQKRVVEHKKVVYGPKSTDHQSISLQNRFEVLSDLVPDDDNYSVKDDYQVKVDGIQSIKKSVDTLNKQSKLCGDSTWRSVKRMEKTKSQDDTKVKNSSLIQGGKVDITNSVEVVKNVMAGNCNCLRNVNVLNLKDKCTDLKACITQQKTVFVFLPISNLKRFRISEALKPNKILTEKEFDPVTIHEVIKSTGKPNFEKARIQLPSKINFELLDEICKNYWDYQVPLFLRYGFPLDFPVEHEDELQTTEVNHDSANRYGEHVEHYIKVEKEHGAIFGPYDEPPYGVTSQVSPFMTRTKNDSEHRRIVIDLSWPKGASINHFTKSNVYLNGVYKLQYPTIDNITEKLTEFGSEARLYKVDLSRAFRQLRIDPKDYNLLCLKWDDKYFSDTYCPFRHRGGAMACTRVTDLFRYVMGRRNDVIYNYVDDLIGVGRSDAINDAFDYLVGLLQDLGFPISKSKLVGPTTQCNCLGIIIDTTDHTLSIPEEKFGEIIKKCEDIFHNTSITLRQLQSVIGSLMFVHKCVKPTRFFINRLLDALRNASTTRIAVSTEMRRDLAWLLRFLPLFNGTTKYIHGVIEEMETLHIDACLQSVGGVWKQYVYTGKIPDIFQKNHFAITHYEMVNILVAIRTWGKQWESKRVVIKTDNMAVVEICRSGYTRDVHLAAIVRNIWLLTAQYDIELSVCHVCGRNNEIADLLSRWCNSQGNIEKLNMWVKNPICKV